jgi:hypothetical protein
VPTVAELETQLANVDAALDLCILTGGGVVSYTISTGEGSRTVMRSLDQLERVRKRVVRELQQAKAAASPTGTPINYGTRGNL